MRVVETAAHAREGVDAVAASMGLNECERDSGEDGNQLDGDRHPGRLVVRALGPRRSVPIGQSDLHEAFGVDALRGNIERIQGRER